MIARTPKIPYYAVIFTSVKNVNDQGYSEMADQMMDLAQKQSGYLGFESARDQIGISVSYWKDLDSIKQWKLQSDHLLAQKMGKEKWYSAYHIRIAKVERQYDFYNAI